MRAAQQKVEPAPLPPLEVASPEPQAPRLRQNDVTIERVATLLANAAPKGLLVVRDEMVGWLAGMNQYHDAGRAFWIEAYGGRPRVERQKHPPPITYLTWLWGPRRHAARTAGDHVARSG